MKTKKNILPNLLSFILNIILGAGISISLFYILLDYNVIATHHGDYINSDSMLFRIIIIALLSVTAIIISGALLNYLIYKLYKKKNADFNKKAISISLLAFILGDVIVALATSLPWILPWI
jgi:biotin transporter BioY